jgi:hypothetical protein
MPTPGGLPKAGEVWELQVDVMGDKGPLQRFVVTERSPGEYWSIRTIDAQGRRNLLVDAPYFLSRGELRYIGVAGPKTKKKLGLG